MTLEEELDVRYSIGKKEGLAEGREEGKKMLPLILPAK